MDEVRGPVERIDDPPVHRGAPGAAFLAEYGVVGEAGPDGVDHEGLRLPVQLRDEIDRARLDGH
jgi:hypothetical protein